MRKVEVVPHNPTWHEVFVEESQHIANALGERVVAIHHIGSTAIANIYAKPIIDLLVEVDNIAAVDQYAQAMERLGYEVLGEYGIPGRRYFRKDNSDGIRTHHVHAFQVGDDQVARHLAFRDYMKAHPEVSQQYSKLKRTLAAQYPTDIDAYMDGKDELIQAVDRQAAEWRSMFTIVDPL
jgi:GrpB-like predicted nucleotidyltransferase (UPF0157 family)